MVVRLTIYYTNIESRSLYNINMKFSGDKPHMTLPNLFIGQPLK